RVAAWEVARSTLRTPADVATISDRSTRSRPRAAGARASSALAIRPAWSTPSRPRSTPTFRSRSTFGVIDAPRQFELRARPRPLGRDARRGRYPEAPLAGAPRADGRAACLGDACPQRVRRPGTRVRW